VYAKLPPKVEIHRPVQDCRDTVSEFRFYRDNFLWTTR
jgi:oligoribonuclease (3'-5' exoribonuclease)